MVNHAVPEAFLLSENLLQANFVAGTQSDLKRQIINLLFATKPAIQKATGDSTSAVALATPLGSQLLTDECTAVQLAIQMAIDATTSSSAMGSQIDSYIEDLDADRMTLTEGLRACRDMQSHLQEKHGLLRGRLIIVSDPVVHIPRKTDHITTTY